MIYPDEFLIVDSVFYVGWEQVEEGNLNVGFDVNNDISDRIFYSITNEWKNTSYSGALMIRPVFGTNLTLGENKKVDSQDEVFLYPNPVSDILYLRADMQINLVAAYNSSGQLAHSWSGSINSIDVANLSPGLYYFLVYTENGLAAREKILIIR